METVTIKDIARKCKVGVSTVSVSYTHLVLMDIDCMDQMEQKRLCKTGNIFVVKKIIQEGGRGIQWRIDVYKRQATLPGWTAFFMPRLTSDKSAPV